MSPWQKLIGGITLFGTILGILGYSLRDVSGKPTILEFSIESSSGFRGEPATLRWRVDGADIVEIDQNIGRVQASGSHPISISNQTYLLTARNRFGPSTQPLAVSAKEPPTPSVQILAQPSTQLKGEPITLSWVAKDADSVVIAGIGQVNATGSRQETAFESRIYEITASNHFRNSAVDRVNVTVQEWPQPTLSLSATPKRVVKGRETLVRWEARYAKSVHIEPFGDVPAIGERPILVTESIILKATADGPGGSQPEEIAIEAVPAKIVTVPRNQEIKVRLTHPLGSAISHSEEEFEATLARDLRIRGETVAVTGARAWGRVASVNNPGRVRGKAVIELVLERLTAVDGSVVHLETISERRDRSNLGKDMLRMIIGGGVGAAVGAATGSAKNVAVGAGGGAAAGAAANVAERGDEVVLAKGYELGFRTRIEKSIELLPPR